MVLRPCSYWCYHSEGSTNCGPQKSSSSSPTIWWNLKLNILNYSCSFKLQLFSPMLQDRESAPVPQYYTSQCSSQCKYWDSLPYCVFISLAIFYVFSLLFLCRSCSGTFQLFLRRNCPKNRCIFGEIVGSGSSHLTILDQNSSNVFGWLAHFPSSCPSGNQFCVVSLWLLVWEWTNDPGLANWFLPGEFSRQFLGRGIVIRRISFLMGGKSLQGNEVNKKQSRKQEERALLKVG